MKKFLLFVFAPLVLLASCSKDKFDSAKQAATDDAAIKAYIGTDTAFHATADGSGVYYKIVTQGTGTKPSASSTVKVTYTGMLLNGTKFASNSTVTQSLSGFIAGWQSGLLYLQTGGRIILVIPSRDGYGNTAQDNIPKNSVLVFTIDLLSFS
ncbi:FKBP-type peptidyl-prolyl cis-trans isomerase FkpA [Mucilaginibacter gossypiicola]|uniref:Peptidyl-prolyl cis-trans isomerase n=1 Tax=Mucilaginibacter gossypiicola TaxID=551995 RepID=A0A1H8E1Y7_9SPHI|nr:FKBP-type peptidyl-prolyl cis-trans isomerase [Mucilaginibacter gossypiicola]SEN13599.1 FKBP-type peptidyl-prolyl cis-trans isomerase FkpA [Mucilaginibacter gossypiicola]